MTLEFVVNMFKSLPPGINGLALANVGISVMWLNLATVYNFRSQVIWPVYVVTLTGIIMLLGYLLHIIFDFENWVSVDIKKTPIIATWGAAAMAI